MKIRGAKQIEKTVGHTMGCADTKEVEKGKRDHLTEPSTASNKVVEVECIPMCHHCSSPASWVHYVVRKEESNPK